MKRIKLSSITRAFMMIPVLIPEGIYSLLGSTPSQRLLIWGIDLLILSFLIAYNYMFKHKKLSPTFVMLVIIYFTIIVSAYIHGRMMAFLSSNFCGLVMFVAFEYWLGRDLIKTLEFVFYTLLILIIVNLSLIILFPNGLYEFVYIFKNVSIAKQLEYDSNWIFGYKNSQFGYTLPFLTISSILKYRKHGRLTFWFLIESFICVLSEFLAKATMATILLLAFAVLIYLVVNKRQLLGKIIRRILNIKTLLLFALVLFFGIVVSTSENWVSTVMVNLSILAGKNTNYNGRGVLWAVAINFIKESPIIGYGSADADAFVEQSRILGGTHAHNYILHILILGGAICLIEHAILYYYTVMNLLKHKSIYTNILGIMIAFFFLDGIVSINFYYPLFNSMFILCFYVVNTICGRRELAINQNRRMIRFMRRKVSYLELRK